MSRTPPWTTAWSRVWTSAEIQRSTTRWPVRYLLAWNVTKLFNLFVAERAHVTRLRRSWSRLRDSNLDTYAAPFRKRNNMKSSYVWLKLEATMHTAFMNEMAIRTFRRPQTYAPAIIPMKMIELSHPFAWVSSFKSHCALGKMKDMEITSISSLVLTKPHTASRK